MQDKKPKKVYGIGINDADYNVYDKNSPCRFYRTWRSMLCRAYCEHWHAKHQSYRGCSVVEEWHLFSNFKHWMEKQDWEGKALDKDLLVIGNKVYSPETCIFISQTVNAFITNREASRGIFMEGVYFEKSSMKFKAQASNPFTGKRENLGRFESESDAHSAWRKRKIELSIQLASSQTDHRVSEALINRLTIRNNIQSPQ